MVEFGIIKSITARKRSKIRGREDDDDDNDDKMIRIG